MNKLFYIHSYYVEPYTVITIIHILSF